METNTHNTPAAHPLKQRHTATTIWLYFVILANIAFGAETARLINLHYGAEAYTGYGYYNDVTRPDKIDLYTQCTMHVAFVVFAIGLLYWKKAAFWGIAIFSCIPLAFKMDRGQEDFKTFLYSVFGMVVLYVFLQFKKNGKTAWSQLE